MKDWFMQYLVFSRKERVGLVVLLVLIGAVWLLPDLFSKSGKLDKEVLAEADSLQKTVTIADSSVQQGNLKIYSLFSFDPNTLDDTGWLKLGIRPKTIGTIRNYLAKGGRFRKASDLSRIYGLRPDESLRLIPYVVILPAGTSQFKTDIERSDGKLRDRSYSFREPGKYSRYASRYTDYPSARNNKRRDWENRASSFHQRKKITPFDINTADTGLFVALPGIGSRLAMRIVEFREKLGGFYKIEQVSEVYGLSDTVYQLIRPFLLLDSVHTRRISVNEADFDQLNAHPYIQYAEARAIVQYRKQHGLYKEINDLLKINLLTNEWVQKTGPYLSTDTH